MAIIGSFQRISGDIDISSKWWNEQMVVDEQNELIRDLMFTSTSMAAMK